MIAETKRPRGRQFRTLAGFIARAKKIHGTAYGYDRVHLTYVDQSAAKVEIYCRACGEYFWQTPKAHVRAEAYGCEKCGVEKQKIKTRITTDQFIERAKARHGERFIYTGVRYVNARTKIIVVCKQHGAIHILPSDHYKYGGCVECAHLVRAERRAKAKEKRENSTSTITI